MRRAGRSALRRRGGAEEYTRRRVGCPARRDRARGRSPEDRAFRRVNAPSSARSARDRARLSTTRAGPARAFDAAPFGSYGAGEPGRESKPGDGSGIAGDLRRPSSVQPRRDGPMPKTSRCSFTNGEGRRGGIVRGGLSPSSGSCAAVDPRRRGAVTRAATSGSPPPRAWSPAASAAGSWPPRVPSRGPPRASSSPRETRRNTSLTMTKSSTSELRSPGVPRPHSRGCR